MPWMAPTLQVQWGAYFKPDPAEQKQVVEMTVAALGGGATGSDPLITKRIAVERLKPIFGIENVDAVLEELEKERDEASERAIAEQASAAEAIHSVTKGLSGEAGKPGAKGGAKPPRTSGE